MEKIIINHSSCEGCGTCVQMCPQNALALIELTDAEVLKLPFMGRLKTRFKGKQKAILQNPESCIECGTCKDNCHERAIKMAN